MVTIREAETKGDLVRFMEYPLHLYRDNPNYVPDILSSQVADMIPGKNPAFEFCKAKCFLAFRGNEIVGRIAAILNERSNEKFGVKYLNFTHLDFIDDPEVSDALFGAVEAWAKELDCTAVHGPLGFSDMDREGLLVEGFDRESLFYTYYNAPYYIEHLNRLGYDKQVDWIEMRVEIPPEPVPQIHRISEFIRSKQALRVISLGDIPTRTIANDVFDLWNNTYTKLFGVVPMTDAQKKKYVSEFLPMLNRKTTSFVYNDREELLAFAIACPSLDSAMKKNHGRTVPFGWIPLLKSLYGRNEQLDLLLIGVRPDMQGSGIAAVLIDDIHRKVIKAGFRYAETGPMLELNDKVQGLFSRFPTETHKRRRCFIKQLS